MGCGELGVDPGEGMGRYGMRSTRGFFVTAASSGCGGTKGRSGRRMEYENIGVPTVLETVGLLMLGCGGEATGVGVIGSGPV